MRISKYKISLMGIGLVIIVIFLIPIYLRVKLFELDKTYKEDLKKKDKLISMAEEFTLSEVIGTIGESPGFKIQNIQLLEDGGEVLINFDGPLESIEKGLEIIKDMDFISEIKNISFDENNYSIIIKFNKNK